MEQEKQYRGEEDNDEIDLMDYVRIILKRKTLIITLFLLAIIASGVFSFLSPKVYKIDTVLEIGEFGEEAVENPSSVIVGIKEGKYKTLVMEEMGITEEDYPEMEIENSENIRLLEIMVLSARPDEAKDILEKIIEVILQEHQKIINIKKTAAERELAEIENTLDLLKEEKVYADKGIADLQLAVSEKKGKLDFIESSWVISGPSISEQPVSPRPIINMAIAGVLGLLVGIFWAIGREWWRETKVKQEID